MLTDDEFVVLSIAAQGESIAAIGRWEKPINDLVARGLMERGDAANNFITPSGRRAMEEHDKEEDEALTLVIRRGFEVNNARIEARNSAEESAKHMAAAIRAAVLATGDSPQAAALKWSEIIVKRALELVC